MLTSLKGLREHLMQVQSSASVPPNPQPDQNIDPAIAGSAYQQMSAGDSGGEDGMGDSRKGRRELSTSKRAAQNRAAQVSLRRQHWLCATIFVVGPSLMVVDDSLLLKDALRKSAY